jgi:hypothetical protein
MVLVLLPFSLGGVAMPATATLEKRVTIRYSRSVPTTTQPKGRDEMADQPNDAKLSRRAYAQQMRRAAGLRAKAHRAKDPRYLALKEAMKQRRRAAYQQAKERRKAIALEQKAREAERRAETRVSKDAELMKLVRAGRGRV